jgi:DNA-binding HxlR family transcriptional regulator
MTGAGARQSADALEFQSTQLCFQNRLLVSQCARIGSKHRTEALVRAGGFALTLLGAPRIFLILQSLTEGPKGQFELRRDAGAPAQSTLRGHLNTLEAVGAIAKERQNSFPGTLAYELTDAGRELGDIAASAGRWLARAPSGPLELGTDPARAAIKGLVEGWSATVLSALASGPQSLTELDKRISAVSYPSIERCLQTMRLAEQLEVGERGSKGTPYALTEWPRRGLTPLAVAARWEHRHDPEGASPIERGDIDDAVLVGGPLFKLSGTADGICQLAVRIPDRKRHDRSLAFVEVKDGELSFGSVYPQVKPDAWASGTEKTWFATVLDADTTGLRRNGDAELIGAIFDSVREALFSDAVRR